MKQVLASAILAAVLLTGCGDDLEDTRFVVSQLPGLYDGDDLPIQATPVADGGPVNMAQLQFTHITSTGFVTATVKTSGTDRLRLFGQLNGEFDPDFNLTNASGTLDVWYEPDMATDSIDYTAGPHAKAKVVSADLVIIGDGDEIEEKQITLELDFEALPDQDSNLDDADFDDYDGEYFAYADNYSIELYEQTGSYARTNGEWQALFDLSSEVELLSMNVNEAGEFEDAEVDGPDFLLGYCDSVYNVNGYIDPYDIVNNRSPKSNTYQIMGDGVCDDDDSAVVTFEGIGWMSGGTGCEQCKGYDQLNFRVEYVFSKAGEDDLSYATRWNQIVSDTTATLTANNDSWAFGLDAPRDLEMDVSYSGVDVPGGFDVNVTIRSLGNPLGCNDDVDVSPQTISCPAEAGECESVIVPFDFNNRSCGFQAVFDAEPPLVDDSDTATISITEFLPCSIEAGSVINGPDDVIEIAC